MRLLKRLKFLMLVILLVAVGLAVYFVHFHKTGLTDAQIEQKFDCSRTTFDGRFTDVYCHDPARYRADLKAGTVEP